MVLKRSRALLPLPLLYVSGAIAAKDELLKGFVWFNLSIFNLYTFKYLLK